MGDDAGEANVWQRDFDTVSSPRSREALQRYRSRLVSWAKTARRFYRGRSRPMD
jgi:hypothetical protein